MTGKYHNIGRPYTQLVLLTLLVMVWHHHGIMEGSHSSQFYTLLTRQGAIHML